MGCLYCGSFPPPYGGVTNKNKMLFEALSASAEVRLPARRSKAGMLFEVLTTDDPVIFGLGSNGNLAYAAMLLVATGRKRAHRSAVVVMGGTLHRFAAERPAFLRALACFGRVYAEAPAMVDALRCMGVKGAALFPNCRVEPASRRVPERRSGRLRCLYFSNVCDEKGARIALETAKALPGISVDFWGEFPDDAYRSAFLEELGRCGNCEYRGVMTARDDSVYDMLSSYDLLLFPSMWEHEGVAGTLVECKIAGVPAVVFDNNFNADVVSHLVEGIVAAPGDGQGFIDAVEKLDADRVLLHELAIGAYRSGERYFLSSYVEEMLSFLSSSSCGDGAMAGTVNG